MSSDSELSCFSESSNRNKDIDIFKEEDEDIEVVYSQYMQYHITISWSCLQHYVIRPCDWTVWLCDQKTIFKSKSQRANHKTFSSNFQNTEKLILLHTHFNQKWFHEANQKPMIQINILFGLILAGKMFRSQWVNDTPFIQKNISCQCEIIEA